MSTFNGLNTALTGLQAHKRVIDVIGQNISNVNSAGYTRRQVLLEPSMGLKVASRFDTDYAWNNLGVDVAGINRIRDQFLDVKARSVMATNASANGLDNIFAGLETIFPEPSDTALAAQMSAFWNSWSDAANHPDSLSNRTAVLAQASSLVESFHHASSELTQAWSDLNQQLRMKVDQVNQLATQVAELNSQIRAASVSGMDTGDLADKRDNLVDQLSALTGAITRPAEFDQVDVMIGGTPIVNGSHVEQMKAVVGGTLPPPLDDVGVVQTNLQWARDGYPVASYGGELGAMVQGLNDVIPRYMDDLNGVVSSMVEAVNTLHRTGQGQAPADVDLDFFDPAGVTAASVKLSADVDGQPSRIALGAAGGGALDGSLGHAIADISNSATGPDALHRTMVGRLGVEAQTASSRAELQGRFLVEAENQRTAISGVNLDEEMTNLVMSQRAYEASARLLTTVDDMLDTLINRTGVTR